MALPTFVPGYLGTVTIDAEDVSAIGNVLSLNLNKPTLNKPVFGSKWGRSIPGQRTGTFSASGHIAAERVAALFALFDGDEPVDFSLQIGEAGQATDGGLIQGKCSINSFTIDANADGEWEWSIQAAIDGAVEHTPPTRKKRPAMAEATGVRVEGIAQLVRSLRRVSDRFPKELKRIHRELAEPIADKAKRRVRSRSGRLAASIRPQAGQRYARVAAGRKGLDRRTGYNYAAINHFGGYPGGYSGNPFLTDTLAAEEHRIYRDYETAVVKLIETNWETI